MKKIRLRRFRSRISYYYVFIYANSRSKLGAVLVFQLKQLRKEALNVCKLAVYRSKANVRNVISLLKIFHDHLTNLNRVDLVSKIVLKLILYLSNYFVCADGALLRRLKHTDKQLVSVKKLLVSVLLDDEDLHRFKYLKGVKSLEALKALTSSLYTVALGNHSGLKHLTLFKSAEGTSHSILLTVKQVN